MYISVQNHLNHPKPTKTNQLSYGKIMRLERPENLRAFPGPDLSSCIYLLFKEFVLQSFLPWACSTSIKQVLVALETHCFIKLYVCFIFVCTHIQNMYQHTGNLFYNPPPPPNISRSVPIYNKSLPRKCQPLVELDHSHQPWPTAEDRRGTAPHNGGKAWLGPLLSTPFQRS